MIEINIDNNLIVNICLHVTILFIFLYFFFYYVISKKGEEVLNSNIDQLCQHNIPIVLADLDKKYKIDWNNVRSSCQYIIDHPDEDINQKITDTNNRYKRIGIYISIGLIVFTCLVYLYFVYSGETIDLKTIMIENLATFLLIGTIEYIFFTMTASKYIPAYPTSIGGIVLDRIKTNIRTI